MQKLAEKDRVQRTIVSLTPDLHARLKKYLEENPLTYQSAVIREALDRFLKEEGTK
jgi:metal-responsive CopG/Arc/MetJ family transcriptional regulator